MTSLSVIVPSYNDSAMLEQCLTALELQTRLPDEVIVVDNGSTDATARVARSHGARVVVEPRRGIPQATAAGFDAARGDVLGRLDADSVPGADWAERVVAAFEADPHLDALSGPGRFYGGSPLVHWAAEHLLIGTYARLVGLALAHDVLFGSNLALRREAWRRIRTRVHRDDRRVHDDLDITMNLEPGMGVRFDRSLVVGVSARPFESWARFWRGVAMAFDTFAVNHRERSLVARRRAWRAERGDAGLLGALRAPR